LRIGNLQLSLVVLAVFLFLPLAIQAQQPPQPPPGSFPQQPTPGTAPNDDPAREKMERDMAKRANHERHEALQRDTNKLLELATQLKEQVDKSTENTLSMDVIKKAEEIEKLAHSVKEKMRGN
jgi:hypothetical protein